MADRMAAAVAKFNKQVTAFAVTLPDRSLVPFVKKIAFEALSRIVLRTPRDTGRAAGNWIIGLGREPKETLERFVGGGRSTGKNVGAVREEIAKLKGLKPFQSVFITNNLPYIEALERGHSPQSPPGGMIELTLSEIGSLFP